MLRTLLAPNPSPMTLDGTRTFVVGRRTPVVVDPGPAIPAHLDAIVAALEGATPAAILLTHGHPDHADAAPALAGRTGAPVMMARGSTHLPFAAEAVGRWLEDGDRVETDAGPVTAVFTPGHSPDHLCFLWRGEGGGGAGGALLAGDLFMGQGDTTLVAPPEGDLAAYLASLDRVAALAPGVLLPAHGPEIADAAEAVRRYRTHRTRRIAQVVDALLRGPARPAGLLDAVYGAGLHPALRGAAEGSLLAILGYLETTGRARVHPDGTFSLTE